MGKLAILKLGEGSFEQGFQITLQVGEEQCDPLHQQLAFLPAAEVRGALPPHLELPQTYGRWQSTYRQLDRQLGFSSRLNAPKTQITNVSITEDCQQLAQHLQAQLNQWLRAESFRPLREKWLEQLQLQDTIRVILQSDQPILQRLPWHLWEILERYPQAELALSLSSYERVVRPVVTPADDLQTKPQTKPQTKLNILAVLGNSQGIDLQADRAILEQLPGAAVTFLVEPERQSLTDALWSKSWDILFFAGHSTSTADQRSGAIQINPTDSLTIPQLKYALKKSVERGLKLAIFNSCDGLGLAYNLSDLQIPQMIVMREPVPDRVAQTFLKSFLAACSQGLPFYQSVREARERLQGLEDQFPCASWLPVICQNPAEVPFSWYGLPEVPESLPKVGTSPPPPRFRPRSWATLILFSLLVTVGTLGLRATGLLQTPELKLLDALMRLRPPEAYDERLLIVTIDEAEKRRYGDTLPGVGQISLSDQTLAQVLQRFSQHQASVIGLDLYRDFPVRSNVPMLKAQYQQEHLIGVCKARFQGGDSIAPPPDLPSARVGFSDFIVDSDQYLRRQLLFMTPDLIDPDAPCTSSSAFSVQLALRYLSIHFPEYRPRQSTSADHFQIHQTIFHRIQAPFGAYQFSNQSGLGGNQILLNYRANSSPAPQVSLTDLLTGQVNPALIENRIVLLGVTAPSAGDQWLTPLDSQMPGVIAQAHMVSQLLSAVLDRRPLIQAYPRWDALWIGIAALLGSRLGSSWGRKLRQPGLLVLALVLANGLLGALSLIALVGGLWLPVLPISLALVLSSGGVSGGVWLARTVDNHRAIRKFNAEP